MTERAGVLLVDDHPLVRQGLRQLLAQEPDLEVCGEASTAAEALAMAEALRPALAIVDLTLGGDDGLDLVKQIASRWPTMLVLVLSMHDDKLYAERALRAGAHGYLMKEEPPANVVTAIRRIRSGAVYLSEELQAAWLKRVLGAKPAELSPMERLTDRELAVFRLLGAGIGTRQIATNLNLSIKTVESYRENIKDKLEIDNATELVRRAALWLHGESGG